MEVQKLFAQIICGCIKDIISVICRGIENEKKMSFLANALITPACIEDSLN